MSNLDITTPMSQFELVGKDGSVTNVPISKPKLNAPEIEINNAVLSISDADNGNFVDKYNIIIDGESALQTQNKEIDLSDLIVDSGEYSVNVKASGENFKDSSVSNSVVYLVELEALTPYSSFTISGNTITGYDGTEEVVNIPATYSIEGGGAGQEHIVNSIEELNIMIDDHTIDFPFQIVGRNFYIETADDIFYRQEEIMRLFDMGYGVGVTNEEMRIEKIFTDRVEFEQAIYENSINFPCSIGTVINVENEDDRYHYEYEIYELFYNGPVIVGKSGSIIEGTDYAIEIISDYVFSDKLNIKKVILPNTIKTLGNHVFQSSSNLTSIIIGSSLASIGTLVFNGCQNLVSIKVRSANTKYDSRDNCNAIIETATNTLIQGCSTTKIPNTVTNIGSGAFNGTGDNLTSIIIPSNIINIGDRAFNGTGLTSVVISNGVETINEYAFSSTNITTITIPGSVISIKGGAFGSCDNLTTIFIDENNPVYDSRENCNAIIETASNTLIQACSTTTIPSTVTSIGKSAFSYVNLTSIIIPDNITTIGAAAFWNCKNLTDVIIGNGLTSISLQVFFYCTNLTNVTVGSSVADIGNSAFFGCSSLKKVDFSTHTIVPTLSYTNAFDRVNSDCKIIVPDALYDQWITATNWSALSSYIIKASEVTE